MIRVITGTAKGKKLLVPDGITRPITDRIKTSLFDLIKDFLPGASVLDVFAGSGALGIESLSRGAGRATFVEHDLKALQIIIKNLENTGFSDRATLRKQDAFQHLHVLEDNGESFDLIFADPPFILTAEEKQRILELLPPLLKKNGLIVFRYPGKEAYPEKIGGLSLAYSKKYGESKINFYK